MLIHIIFGLFGYFESMSGQQWFPKMDISIYI